MLLKSNSRTAPRSDAASAVAGAAEPVRAQPLDVPALLPVDVHRARRGDGAGLPERRRRGRRGGSRRSSRKHHPPAVGRRRPLARDLDTACSVARTLFNIVAQWMPCVQPRVEGPTWRRSSGSQRTARVRRDGRPAARRARSARRPEPARAWPSGWASRRASSPRSRPAAPSHRSTPCTRWPTSSTSRSTSCCSSMPRRARDGRPTRSPAGEPRCPHDPCSGRTTASRSGSAPASSGSG